MLIKSQDVGPGTLFEIRELIEKEGECCIPFLERKFDALILIDRNMIEVYQLPEGEV